MSGIDGSPLWTKEDDESQENDAQTDSVPTAKDSKLVKATTIGGMLVAALIIVLLVIMKPKVKFAPSSRLSETAMKKLDDTVSIVVNPLVETPRDSEELSETGMKTLNNTVSFDTLVETPRASDDSTRRSSYFFFSSNSSMS